MFSKEGETRLKQISKIVIATLAMFILLLPSSQLANAKEWEFQPTNDVKKVWEIWVNVPLELSSLTANSVYVLDGKNKHATTLRLGRNGYTVLVSPTVPYVVGKKYVLMITTAVKSSNRKALKVPIEVPFQVVNPADDIQSIHSHSTGILTNLTVTTSQGVHKVTVAGEDMRYRGNNKFTTTLIDAKPGSMISVTGYDEKNKRLEVKRYKLGGG